LKRHLDFPEPDLRALAAAAVGPSAADLDAAIRLARAEARATGLALSIDATCGLGAHGPVWRDTPGALLLREPDTHDRVRTRIETAEDRATAILAPNRGLLEGMAEALTAARELDEAAGIPVTEVVG